MSLRLGVALLLVGLCLAQGFTRSNHGNGNGKGWRTKRPHRWGNLTSEQIEKFKKSLPVRNVDRYLTALDRMRDRDAEKTVSDAEKENWNTRLKQIKTHVRSERLSNGVKSVKELNEKSGVAESLYQDDIALTDAQVDVVLGEYVDDLETTGARKRRQAANFGTWGTTVNYFYDPSVPAEDRKNVQMAIDFWQNSTCINFVQSSTATDRIRIFRGDGCWSVLGKAGGQQDMSIGPNCGWFEVAAHEFGHALGFWHQQARIDRDAMITVAPNMGSEYEKQSTNINYGMPYDYGSIMHYTPSTTNGVTSMVATIPAYQDVMGGKTVPFYDISMMNEKYECKKKCPTGANCANGGFRNSRNCNSCICPNGWAGPTCAERPSGCGATLTATSTLQTLTNTLGDGAYVVGQTFATCNYLIQAPIGNKIELVIKEIKDQQCGAGCVYGGMEVKAINDHRYTGMRYCCTDDVNTRIISEGNIVPVIFSNRWYKSTVTITYRTVPDSTAPTVKMSQVPNAVATTDLNSNCEMWAKSGECKINPIWMLPNCPKSCRSVSLTDLNSNCEMWAKSGECKINPAYMLPNCPKACESVTLTDLNPNCEMWAKSGECKINPTYMLPNCPKSCQSV